MSVSVSGIGAIGTSDTSVYAVLSPYLNGVIRTSDAAQAASLDATAQATSASATAAAIAANGAATAAATASPPFANPAIAAIGAQIALGQSLTPPAAVTPDALLGSTGTTSTATLTPLQQAEADDTTIAVSTVNATNENAITTLNNASNASNVNGTTALGNAAALNAPSLQTTAPFATPGLTTPSFDTLSGVDASNTASALNSLTAANTLDATTDATQLTNLTALQQTSPTNQVLFGDSGTLIQSYGALALLTGPQAAAAYAPFAAPAVTAKTAVSPIEPVSAVA
jgi:hypothetical protein